MSLTSYRRNVSLGATGAHRQTCFPSALEQISPSYSLTPTDYNRYVRGIGTLNRLHREGGNVRRQINPFAKKLFTSIVEPLGCEFEDVEFRRVKNAYNLKRLVNSALNQGCRVAVDLDMKIKDTSHPAGLIPLVDGKFLLVSNHVPFGLKVASLDEVFPFMDQSTQRPSTQYPFATSNVTVLPPEWKYWEDITK